MSRTNIHRQELQLIDHCIMIEACDNYLANGETYHKMMFGFVSSLQARIERARDYGLWQTSQRQRCFDQPPWVPVEATFFIRIQIKHKGRLAPILGTTRCHLKWLLVVELALIANVCRKQDRNRLQDH